MPPKPRVRAGGAARPTPVKDTSAPGYGRVLTCLRIRLALTDEEGGVDNVALQCDRSQRLAWALGGEDSADEAPRQFAFDELLEQHQQQQECFDAVGAPAVKAAIAGGTGCVVCYGAKGAGKWYSMNNQSVGQEGIVPRINAMLFAGRGGTGGASMRLPAKDDVAEEQRLAKMRIEVAYLVLTKEQQVRDLLAGAGVALSTDPLSDPLRFATWQPAASAAEVSRLLARGDANKPQGLERGAGLKEWHSLVAYRLTQDNGASGTLLLASLADADAVISDGLASSTCAPAASDRPIPARPPFARSHLGRHPHRTTHQPTIPVRVCVCVCVCARQAAAALVDGGARRVARGDGVGQTGRLPLDPRPAHGAPRVGARGRRRRRRRRGPRRALGRHVVHGAPSRHSAALSLSRRPSTRRPVGPLAGCTCAALPRHPHPAPPNPSPPLLLLLPSPPPTPGRRRCCCACTRTSSASRRRCTRCSSGSAAARAGARAAASTTWRSARS